MRMCILFLLKKCLAIHQLKVDKGKLTAVESSVEKLMFQVSDLHQSQGQTLKTSVSQTPYKLVNLPLPTSS